MKLVRQKTSGKVQPNMTPMIDIVFLLIIFFMTVSKFSSDAAEEMDLPQSQKGSEVKEDLSRRLIINLKKDGALSVQKMVHSPSEVSAIIASEAKRLGGDNLVVVLRMDREAKMGGMKKLMGLVAGQGVRNVKVAVTPDQ